MIDRKARKETAALLRHFITGQITNVEFEDSLPLSEDEAVEAVVSSAWCFYDDFKTHKLRGRKKLKKNEKKQLARWIMFLYTEQEYEWPFIPNPGVFPIEHSVISKILGKEKKEQAFMALGEYEYWPFLKKEYFEAARLSPKLLNFKVEVK